MENIIQQPKQFIATPYWAISPLKKGMMREIPSYSPHVQFRRHRVQLAFYNSITRFTIAAAGRRGGKSEIALRRLYERMLFLPKNANVRNFFISAPTRDQVKRIYWDKLKRLVPTFLVKDINESELKITLKGHGATVYLLGLDRPQRFEGTSFVGGIIDEFGNIKPEAWNANVRPALEDTRGYADILGVPEMGGIHYQELFERALADTTGTWSAYTWASSTILDPDIIAAAKRDLDEETFNREYGGQFIKAGNIAYYAYSKQNVASVSLRYFPELPLDVSFDFNVEPSVCVICQTHPDKTTWVLDEIYIQKQGNTAKLMDAFTKKYQPLGVRTIRIFGDMTGMNRHTSQTEGHDYDLIGAALDAKMPLTKVIMPYRKANPLEMSRIITVNSRLKSYRGDIKLLISPHCKYLIRDLDNVQRKPSGELDKGYSPDLTHISDALGYYLHELFGDTVNTALLRNSYVADAYM